MSERNPNEQELEQLFKRLSANAEDALQIVAARLLKRRASKSSPASGRSQASSVTLSEMTEGIHNKENFVKRGIRNARLDEDSLNGRRANALNNLERIRRRGPAVADSIGFSLLHSAAVNDLPPVAVRILQRRFVDGVTWSDIASEHDCHHSTIFRIVQKAFLKLRECLEGVDEATSLAVLTRLLSQNESDQLDVDFDEETF